MENKENMIETPALEATAPTKTTRKTTKKASTPSKSAPARKKIKKVDLQELVEVQSCTYGTLYYRAPDGNEVRWKTFGDVAWMTVGDLMIMRNSQRDFFEEQLICLCGDNAMEVLEYLQVDKYYKDIKDTTSFDIIFEADPAEVPAMIEKLSDGAKETLARRAYAKVQNNELDSVKMVKVLEEALGYDLTTPQ